MVETKILFVCLGNICRSPMAEAILNNHDEAKKLKITSKSAGTANYHENENADPRTISTLKNHHIKFSHKAAVLKHQDYKDYDLILAMDNHNYKNIISSKPAGGYKAKIMMLSSFDDIKKNSDIPDPYYGSIEDFELVFVQLSRCINELINQFKKNNTFI